MENLLTYTPNNQSLLLKNFVNFLAEKLDYNDFHITNFTAENFSDKEGLLYPLYRELNKRVSLADRSQIKVWINKHFAKFDDFILLRMGRKHLTFTEYEHFVVFEQQGRISVAEGLSDAFCFEQNERFDLSGEGNNHVYSKTVYTHENNQHHVYFETVLKYNVDNKKMVYDHFGILKNPQSKEMVFQKNAKHLEIIIQYGDYPQVFACDTTAAKLESFMNSDVLPKKNFHTHFKMAYNNTIIREHFYKDNHMPDMLADFMKPFSNISSIYEELHVSPSFTREFIVQYEDEIEPIIHMKNI